MRPSEATLQKLDKIADFVDIPSRKAISILLPPTVAGNTYFLVHDAITRINAAPISVDINPTMIAGVGMVALGLPAIIKDIFKKNKVSKAAIGLAGLGIATALIPEVAHFMKDFTPVEMGAAVGFSVGVLAEAIREIKKEPQNSFKRQWAQIIGMGMMGGLFGGLALPDNIKSVCDTIDAYRVVTPLAIHTNRIAAVVGGGAVALVSGVGSAIASSVIWSKAKSKSSSL